MKWFIRTLLVIVAAFPTFTFACPPPPPQWYPNIGSFYYDGNRFAQSYLNWLNPGGWSVSDPGYEHDLLISPNFFTACTSFTNLPNGYDDCSTAGFEDDPNLWSFTFGSFHARNIQAQAYYGSWNFSAGSASSTSYKLNAQEVQHYFCPFDFNWCMNGIRSQPGLLRGTLRRGTWWSTCWPQDGLYCP